MRIAAAFSIVLAAVATSVATPLSFTGIYNLVVGGLALSHTSNTSAFSTSPLSGAISQAWSVFFNQAAGLATIQNVNTLAYVSTVSATSVVPSAAPFLWNVIQAGDQSLFCTTSTNSIQRICISTVGAAVTVSPQNSSAPKNFDLLLLNQPPSAWYQVQNIITNTVFGVGFPPSPAFVNPAPATDRSQIWFVGQPGNQQITLANLDLQAFLSVAANGTVGAFSLSAPFRWSVFFTPNLGYVLQSNSPLSGVLNVANNTLKIGTLTQASGWAFAPVNTAVFLP